MRVGQLLGNYRLTKLLGRGGYAEVYLAENVYLGIQTAIKVLKLQDLTPLEQEEFRSEAKKMTTLQHPHIIKVTDYGIEMSQRGTDGSTPYLVMEYAPLGTLRQLYPHKTPMPLPKIVIYTKQMAEALQYAHNENIIHCDIKPENMLVRRPDNAALSDFGIAVTGLNTGNLSQQHLDIVQKIKRGEQIAVPGTAPYLAPERIKGFTQRASDQYSLAIVVYEWLIGKRPFNGDDMEICRQQIEETPPPFHQTNSSVSKEVEQVVMRALAKEPKDRYGSVIEFAQALESAISASLPIPQPSPIIPQPSPIIPQPSPISQPNNTGGGNQWQQQVHLAYDPQFNQQSTTVNSNLPPISTPLPSKSTFPPFVKEIVHLFEEPVTRTREILITDKFFIRTKVTRQFLLIGIPVNLLSVLIATFSGPLPNSVFTSIIGGAIVIGMLWRCAVSLKQPIAITFGIGVALWWGYVAESAATHLPYDSIALPTFLLAFAISLIIHVRYVNNKLK